MAAHRRSPRLPYVLSYAPQILAPSRIIARCCQNRISEWGESSLDNNRSQCVLTPEPQYDEYCVSNNITHYLVVHSLQDRVKHATRAKHATTRQLWHRMEYNTIIQKCDSNARLNSVWLRSCVFCSPIYAFYSMHVPSSTTHSESKTLLRRRKEWQEPKTVTWRPRWHDQLWHDGLLHDLAS